MIVPSIRVNIIHFDGTPCCEDVSSCVKQVYLVMVVGIHTLQIEAQGIIYGQSSTCQ